MRNKSQRNQSETARRKKRTVITKVHEYGKLPGVHVKKVELGLADKKMTADLFCVVFKPMEGDVALLKNAQSDVLVRSGENRKVDEAARSQGEEVKRVERLAEEFAARVPELKLYHFFGRPLIMWRYG
jgi:hypothetical protein